MLGFIIGGLYTLTVLLVGFIGGWWLRSRTNDEVVREVMDEIKERRKPGPSPASGPLKPLSREDRLREDSKEIQKVEKILGDL